MQTHHLSHRVRGQRYMWATVTRLKVTPPDKSNLLHWRELLDWCVSHLLAMPSQRSGIDGRAAWWAVPAPYLSVCLLLQHWGIYLSDNRPKQTDLTGWKLPAGFARDAQTRHSSLMVFSVQLKEERSSFFYFSEVFEYLYLQYFEFITYLCHLCFIGNRLEFSKQLVLHQHATASIIKLTC